MSIQSLVVGQPFPEINKIPQGEGTSLNYSEDGSLSLVIRFSSFTSEEKNKIKKGVMQFRYMRTDKNVLLLVRFGSLPPMELPFDPTIYKKQGVEFKVLSNSLWIYAVDHQTSILVCIRTIGLHPEFVNHLCSIWYKDCGDDISSSNTKFRIQYRT